MSRTVGFYLMTGKNVVETAILEPVDKQNPHASWRHLHSAKQSFCMKFRNLKYGAPKNSSTLLFRRNTQVKGQHAEDDYIPLLSTSTNVSL